MSIFVSLAGAAPDPARPWLYKFFRKRELTGYRSLESVMSQHVWSAIVWENGDRAELNFRGASFAVLDFDTPEMPLREALNTFSDSCHIIGTTKSHQKEKNGVICDRYRVVLPFTQEITDLAQYRFNMRLFYNKYPCDKCIDGARYFFPCTEIVSVVSDGYKQDVIEGREEQPVSIYTEEWAKAGAMPAMVNHARQILIPPGKRNTYFYGLAKDLVRCGYSDEQILKVFRHSKTYKDCWSDTYERELKETIKSARKRAMQDDGRK